MLGGKIRYIFYIVFSFNIFLFGKTNFQIYLWSLNVAEVNIETNQIKFENIPSTHIIYKAQTKGIYNYIYKINNIYEVIIDNKNRNILSFKKFINQPNLVDTLYTQRINNKTIYPKLNQHSIKENSLNIFTLIYFLMNKQNENILDENILIDRDGDEFECKIDRINNSERDLYFISINEIEINNYIEKTDIFSWALFKNNVKRKIWINDYNDLYKCEFESGLMTFTAKKTHIK